MLSSTRAREARHGHARRVPPAGGWAALAATAGVLVAAAPAAAHAQPAPDHLLLQGSKGRDVAKVQRALNIRGNGHFDRGTTSAVIRFQRHGHLLVDGIVGPQTWNALFHLPPVAPAPAAPAATAASTAGPSSSRPSTYAGTGSSTGSSSYQGSDSSGPSYHGTGSSGPSYAGTASSTGSSYTGTGSSTESSYTGTGSSYSGSSGSSGASGSSGSGGYSIPSGIVQCESGGNYSAVNSSSGAGGAYQIMPSTWQAYGGQGLPQNASKSEQDSIAARIYASQGASAWTCKG